MERTTAWLLVILFLAAASAASGAELGPSPAQPLLESSLRLVTPPGPVYSLGTPSPQRPAVYGRPGVVSHQLQALPQAGRGWSGYGLGGVPSYQWGYFGAHYRPVKVYHRGYYGHQMSYGYRRGY